MPEDRDRNGVLATCHCGAVAIEVPSPNEVTQCNCSLCRRYGVIWAYYPIAAVSLPADAGLTETYAWGGRNVDFHRCRHCGCVTHWSPRDKRRERMGINARLLEPEVLAAAQVRHKDAAGTGLFT